MARLENFAACADIRFLCTYINVRPGELIQIKEKDVDLDNARILVGETKTGDPKYIYLIDSDVKLLSSMPKSFGELYLFRHVKPVGGVRVGDRFGKDYLYAKWKAACKALEVDCDLYGGSRHSSAIDLRKRHSPEAIKRATMHGTNAAFDRYLKVTGDELRGLYADTGTDNEVITFPGATETDNPQKTKVNIGAGGENRTRTDARSGGF